MKVGVLFEDNKEFEDKLHVSFIAETFANIPKCFEDESLHRQQELEWTGWDPYDYNRRDVKLNMFQLTTQIKLKEAGIGQKELDMCQKQIRQAKEWCVDGFPLNTVLDMSDIETWKLLRKITEIVAGV